MLWFAIGKCATPLCHSHISYFLISQHNISFSFTFTKRPIWADSYAPVWSDMKSSTMWESGPNDLFSNSLFWFPVLSVCLALLRFKVTLGFQWEDGTCTHLHTHTQVISFLFASVRDLCDGPVRLKEAFHKKSDLARLAAQTTMSSFTESFSRKQEHDPRQSRFPAAHISEPLSKHYCNINHNDTVNHKAQGVIKWLSLLSALVKHLPGAIYLLL